MARAYQVISADSHVNPQPTFWRDYLPKQYRDAAPRLEHGDEIDYILFEGKRTPFGTMGQLAGKRPEEYKQHGRKNDARPGGWEPGPRIEDQDLDGLDGEVIYGGGPLGTSDPDLHLASYEAYNRWLADFCGAAPNRLFGIGYCPMYDVDFAIEQMRTAASVGLKGVVIPAFPQTQGASGGIGTGGQLLALGGDPSGSRTYADAEFNPFWEASIDLNMPVHMHLGARSTRLTPERFIVDMVMTKLTMAEPIAYLVFGGVLQRHPDLKFVSVESGVGWFAFVGHYMDHLWQKHRYWTNSTLIEVPSFYMDRQVYGTFLDDPVGVELRQHAGAKNIMWSSDYPHSETTFPNSLGMIADNFKGVPEADKQRMICGTAMELYGITSG